MMLGGQACPTTLNPEPPPTQRAGNTIGNDLTVRRGIYAARVFIIADVGPKIPTR